MKPVRGTPGLREPKLDEQRRNPKRAERCKKGKVYNRVNKRQKAILMEFITVVFITAIAVVAMINLKDWVNRSEAMRAMEHLGQEVFKYRKDNGVLPSDVDNIKKGVPGWVRLGNLRYRARWIDFFEATTDEVLAYTEKNYRSSLLSDGYVVLRLDGRVEWMGKEEFEKLLAEQQSEFEIEMLRK